MNFSRRMKRRMVRAGIRLAAGAMLGVILIGGIYRATLKPEPEPTPAPEPLVTVTAAPVSMKPDPIPVPTPEPVKEPEPVFMGVWRITAYCACEKCCGKWALNRPNGIVYGAYGKELKAGVSCASPLPYGTKVEIEGLGVYTVQDKIAGWVVEQFGENQIDIYFDSHEAACEFGLQYLPVYLKEE